MSNFNKLFPEIVPAAEAVEIAQENLLQTVCHAYIKYLQARTDETLKSITFNSFDEYHRDGWITQPAEVETQDGRTIAINEDDFTEVDEDVIYQLQNIVAELIPHGPWSIHIDDKDINVKTTGYRELYG
jgi:hypothetical protein